MKKLLIILCSLFLISVPYAGIAQDWSLDIAPIFYQKCTNCHNSSGIAPFSLITYNDAVSKKVQIEDAVSSGEMPPWPPDPNYRRFAHERTLTAQEIATIVNWVQNNTPLGDTSLAPAPPVYSGLAEITNPDLVARMPNYTVNTVNDLYRCFVVPSGLSANRYLTQLETLPGNRGIVHHVLIYEDTSSVPANLDAQDPGPGYTSFGGTGSSSSKLIGIWVPGQEVFRLPASMGIKLQANTNIILQVHYPGGTFNATDSTEIRFKLSATPLREVYITPPLNHFQLDNGPLYIPANTVRTFTAHYSLPFEISALGVGPHMHLIGKSINSYGVTPLNDTIPFIDIPDWDFHWQGLYSFPRVLHLPAGTTLYSSATYDNTLNNPHNPNNPPRPVALGEATTDEMMLIYFVYAAYLPGDENIIQDSTIILNVANPSSDQGLSGTQFYPPYPNPGSGMIQLDFYLPHASEMEIVLLDMQGQIVRNILTNSRQASGWLHKSFNTKDLAAGCYFVRAQGNDFIRQHPLIIQE